MTNEQIKEIVARSEDEHEYLKDRVHDLYDENVKLKGEIERLHSIIKEVREKVDSFDVFKEFTFPLMKRDVENQVKSSIDYEWRKTIKEPILEILDKVNNNED